MTDIKCEACSREFNDQEALAKHNAAKHNIPFGNSKESKAGISKKTIFLIIIILAIIIIGYFFISGSFTGNTTSSGDIQKITISMKNYNYYPNTITVEAGKPVEITLDSSVGGCYRSFNIAALGVSYTSASPSDTIKFTPTQKGTFEFACSMHMGKGTIIVN